MMTMISTSQLFAISALLFSVSVTGFPMERVNDGVSRIGFSIDTKRAHPKSSIAKRLLKRADDEKASAVSLENLVVFYAINATLGTPGQDMMLGITMGSSDSWVFKKNNPYCSSSSSLNKKRELIKAASSSGSDSTRSSSIPSYEQTWNCDLFGSFDDSASDSLKVNDSAAFNMEYVDGTVASGLWATDTWKIGDLELDDFQFGLADQASSNIGLLGLGPMAGESTNENSTNNYTYENFPVRLKKDGYIKKIAYSLYLNSFNASSGSILFGGVDHAKYSGSLVTLPMIDQYEDSGITEISFVSTTVSAVGVDAEGNQTTFSSTNSPATIDPGTTLIYLPSEYIEAITEALGASYSSYYSAYSLDCPSLADSLSKFIVFDFQGQKVSVPLYQLIRYKIDDENKCFLGIDDSMDDTITLGTSFLRSAYLVVDLEDKQVSIAQAKYTDDEDIEVIESFVPSATSAPKYSSSWTEYQFETDTTNMFSSNDSATSKADVFGYTGGSIEGDLSIRATSSDGYTYQKTESSGSTSAATSAVGVPSEGAYDGSSSTSSASFSSKAGSHQLQLDKSLSLTWLELLFLSLSGALMLL